MTRTSGSLETIRKEREFHRKYKYKLIDRLVIFSFYFCPRFSFSFFSEGLLLLSRHYLSYRRESATFCHFFFFWGNYSYTLSVNCVKWFDRHCYVFFNLRRVTKLFDLRDDVGEKNYFLVRNTYEYQKQSNDYPLRVQYLSHFTCNIIVCKDLRVGIYLLCKSCK